MIDRPGIKKDRIKINLTKCYKGREVVESRDHPHSEGTCHIEDRYGCCRQFPTSICQGFFFFFSGTLALKELERKNIKQVVAFSHKMNNARLYSCSYRFYQLYKVVY